MIEVPGKKQASSVGKRAAVSPHALEFFVPFKGRAAAAGKELPLKVYCGNTISTLIRVLPPRAPQR
jgi:hypothetical protein